MKILVLNCGSSSIKYKFFEMPAEKVLAQGAVEKIGDRQAILDHRAGQRRVSENLPVADHEEALALINRCLLDPEKGVIGSADEVEGVGHRVVHGGEGFDRSVVIDGDVLARIRQYRELAPLHNPHNLKGIEVAGKIFPAGIQVATFDTAFHRTMPPVAYLYGLPYRFYLEHRIRRYGFHGTSHHHVTLEAARHCGLQPEAFNGITCHLGNGCSMTAVRGGRSVDTSMGLTPLEGLLMGTRSGDLDPGVIFHLADRLGLETGEIGNLLNKESGLLGISGLSNDLRNLEEGHGRGNEMATLALEIFCYRIKKYLGAYFFALGRVDAVVFTGGIGENSPLVREMSLEGTAEFGLRLDSRKNRRTIVKKGVSGEISETGAPVSILVIPTDEELRIARETYEATGKT